MIKKNFRVLSLVLCLSLLLTAVGCGGGGAPAGGSESGSDSGSDSGSGAGSSSDPQVIQICGATSGGTYFLLANAIAQVLNTEAGDIFRASAQSTAGTPANIRLMEDGETDFAFGQSGVALQALNGEGAFDKAYTNISSVTYVYPNVMQIAIRKGSNIEAFADFEGKTFAAGAAGSATELNTRDMFDAAGISYDDVTIEYTSETQSAELMKDRQADGANLIAALGAAAMTDLMSSGDADIYSFSDEELDAIIDLNSAYFKYTIPAGTYPNQDYEVKTFAVANYIFARKDLPEDLVYEFTKAVYENKEALVSVHSIANNILPESATDGLTVPLHPGAEKYFKEIGAL